LPRSFGDDLLDQEDLDFIRTVVTPSGAIVPSVWTNFRRATLLGRDFNERATIDLALEVTSIDLSLSVAFPRMAIIELKQPRLNRRSPLAAALRSAAVRPTSASKYCTGIMMTQPTIRKNRLLPSLRNIQRANT